MSRSFPKRATFTLIEFGVIAIWIGLLPSVQKVREAAARLKRGNYRKLLGLVPTRHHDASVPALLDANF